MNKKPLRAITQADIETYERDGAVCLRQVFDQDWIDMLEPITRRLVAGESYGLLPHRPMNFMAHCIDEFRQLAFESPLGEACGRVMQSKEVRFYFDQIFAKKPRSNEKTVWHNDRAGWAVTGKMIPSFWMPLTPITKANCLEVIAGTHRQDVRYWNSTANSRQMVRPDGRVNMPDGEAVRSNEDYRFLAWDMQPGDALLVHPWVLHYSSGNPTDDWRLAVSVRPLGDDIRWDPRPECVNIAGLSFDEMIPGAKPQGSLVPLIWSEDGRRDDCTSFPRGFGVTWAPGDGKDANATTSKVYETFAKDQGALSQIAPDL